MKGLRLALTDFDRGFKELLWLRKLDLGKQLAASSFEEGLIAVGTTEEDTVASHSCHHFVSTASLDF